MASAWAPGLRATTACRARALRLRCTSTATATRPSTATCVGAFEVVADVKLALGELTVKLQLTFFPLPETHKWYGKSIAQRLEACGWRLLEIEVKAVAPSPAASHKRASSSSTTPGTEAAKRSKQAN